MRFLLNQRAVRRWLPLISFVSFTVLFQNCGVQRPRVEQASYSSTTFTPEGHQSLPSNTQCNTCHESARPLVKTLLHNFNHTDPNFVTQDCSVCHNQKQNWGITWGGGQFSHIPIPKTCLECHSNQMPNSTIFISNNSALPFNHTAGNECATCHKNTSKFNSYSDWRPASAEPNGLIGNKGFSTNIIDITFNGSDMIRSLPQSKTFKLEIDHSQSMLSNLSCNTCHSSATSSTPGSYTGALFHKNITSNPTSCNECHINALPMGAVGSKGLMRHEAVGWVTNTIGSVSRGTTPITQADCVTCHLNSSSMPVPGSTPLPGSKPFSDSRFHINTDVGTYNSCLDCHAHSRPSGATTFTNISWKSKTNTGTTLTANFTTFNLNSHASNVECATCHKAPTVASTSNSDWSPGYFLHNTSTLNCLVCHTASGVTSQNHSGFSSNCITCHTGAATQFPNPVVSDWKVGVTGGTPSGVVGERVVSNSSTCVGVLGAVLNCTSSNPNNIPKGYNHLINTVNVSCQNCHGSGVSTSTNGKFHTPPAGSTSWTPPSTADISNCNACHDPTVLPSTVVSVKSIGIIGSQINQSTGPTPFAGVNHNHGLVYNKSCSDCHTAPTPTKLTTWNQSIKIHSTFTPSQITTCSECHYKRMPSGILQRKNQFPYKGISKPQNFTHTSKISIPSLALQQCSTCHTNDGVSWTTAGKVSFHDKVTTSNNCNLCHLAPGGVVTSSTTGISYNHDLVTTLGDCVACHSSTLSKINARVPVPNDWDGGVAAPSSYTIPSHSTSGFTVPGYTGTHTSNPNCSSCHGTGNYKVITQFDHQGLPTTQNSCVSCHLGSKLEVAAFIASTSTQLMSTDGPSRHHPPSIFKGTDLSCVGCHTLTKGSGTFNTSSGINFPALAKSAYLNFSCSAGGISGTTFACHNGGKTQRLLVVPTTTTGTGSWNK